MRKLKGGIGALARHLEETFVAHGGEVRLRSAVSTITVADGRKYSAAKSGAAK